MTRKGARQIVFVCASLSNTGELITKIIPAESQDEANKAFVNEFTVQPKEVLGPFYKKRTRVLESTRILKFSNETKQAVFNDWMVNAFLLKEPENHAYLVFIKRTDDNKSIPLPKGTNIVPISELRFL